MLSGRQHKPKATKLKEPKQSTTKRSDPHVLAELGSTFANSRSMSRCHHSQKNKKQIPKILSKIEKNVQDLKKYCSDVSPNPPKKNYIKYPLPGQGVRTVNDSVQSSTMSVDEVKKTYMSIYGKETESIVQLWKFYNSFIGKSKSGKTSKISQSASIPAQSQFLPQYSLQSKNDSGRGSALGSLDRIPLQNINISDLLSNRPSGRRSNVQKILVNRSQQVQQTRPLQKNQKISNNGESRVRSVQFNLQAQLDLVAPLNQIRQTPKFEPQTIVSKANQEVENKIFESKTEIQTHVANVHCWSFTQLQVKTQNIIKKSEGSNTKTLPKTMQQIINTTENIQSQGPQSVEKTIPVNQEEIKTKLVTKQQDKDFFKKIFQKNMLINKRKQELNSKLKKQKEKQEVAKENNNGHYIEGLDQAVIFEEDKPLFLQDELPLSKQDISLLQKLDQLDKQIVPLPKSDSENRLHEALKGMKKKKKFNQSKFSVAQIPIKKQGKKPQVLDIEFEQQLQDCRLKDSIGIGHEGKLKNVNVDKKQCKVQINSSFLSDCIIQAVEGQDSFLRNCQQNYQNIESQGVSPLDLVDF